jgi:glycosyltransferase involved in cell wall biosynthesis
MSNIVLSILVPSIPSRIDKFLKPLYSKLESQSSKVSDVEVLCLLDNKKRSIGLKRDALLRAAQGKYVAFVDDDDDISDDYVEQLRNAIYHEGKGSDVIVFDQIASINNNQFRVRFGIEFENEQAEMDPYGQYKDIVRKPFHVCAWKRELAIKYKFPDCSYGEDWYWAKQVLGEVSTQYRIDKILHYYRYNDSVTEAELIFPPEQDEK